MKEIRGAAKCVVQGDEKVRLTVSIGNAQLGASAVDLGDRTWKAQAEVKELELGTGSSLVDQELVISSVVTDVQPETNALIVTYTITGAGHPFEQSLGAVVEENRDAAFFAMTVSFSGGADA